MITNDELDRLLAPYFSTLGRKVEDIKNLQLPVPQVTVPEVKIPEIKVPNIIVPEIKIPEIKLPDIKIPPIHVPKSEVTVNVDAVKIKNWPKIPEFDDKAILAALKRLENKSSGGGGGSAPQYQDTTYNTDGKLWGTPIMWQEPVTVGSTSMDQTNIVSALKPLPVSILSGTITATLGDIQINDHDGNPFDKDYPAAVGTGFQTHGGIYQTSPTTLTNGQVGPVGLTSTGITKVSVYEDSDKYVRGTSANAATDDASEPVKIGGVYLSTPVAITNGQRGDIQLGQYGTLKSEAWSGATPIQSEYGAFVQGGVAHDAPNNTYRPVRIGGVAKAAAPADVSADNDVTQAWFLRNGAQAVNITAAGALIGGDAGNGLDVDVTRLPAITGTVIADTELPAAAALADNVASNPTVPTVGAAMLGMDANGADNIDRARLAKAHNVDTGATTEYATGVSLRKSASGGSFWG
jgi:hypothetical protein